MSKSTWTGAVSTDWADADNWSPAGVPGGDSDVTIATGNAVASASIGTVNSITDSSSLRFRSAGTNTVATILDNTGHLHVDDSGGEGGTTLNIGGTLTNSHALRIGNATLSASDAVTAASLDNTGSIYLTGSSTNQALLDVTGSAGFGTAGVLSGYARLAGDSAIVFASGEITSLAAHAQLHLNGNDAFIEDSTALGKNSAFMGLASIGAGAIFGLHNEAAVSTTGSLVNHGDIRLDIVGGDGGSSLTLTGALTNHRNLTIGNTTLSASDKVTAAALGNTGKIQLTGSGANQALLDVTGSAGFGRAGILSGFVQLAGNSAIKFASGQITSLANGAQLLLGNDAAFIEDSTKLGSNSALTGLASIGAGAGFELAGGASVSTTGALVNHGDVLLYESSVSTTGALVNNGDIYLDYQPEGGGGSSLTVAGTLTNTDALDIGNLDLSSSDSVTAEYFVNSGTVDLTGDRTNSATLSVSGATTNNDAILITTDTEEFAGAVRGKGSFSLYTANLLFDSSVSAGQTIKEHGADALTLKHAQNFAATISGFGTGDTIDATNFLKTATSYNFVENLMGTGGTLTLTDTSLGLTANILMTGVYSNKSFSLAHDSGTGTLVKFV